jgi:hypothetical protein
LQAPERQPTRGSGYCLGSAERSSENTQRFLGTQARLHGCGFFGVVMLLRNLRLSKVCTMAHGRDPPANRWIVVLAATARDGDAAHLGHGLQIITLSTIAGCCRPIRDPRPHPGRTLCAGIAWEAKDWRDPSPRTKRASAAYDGYHVHHCVPGCFRVSRFSISPSTPVVFEE